MYSSLLSLQIQTWLEKKSSTINKLYLYLTNMIFEEFVKKDRIFLPFFLNCPSKRRFTTHLQAGTRTTRGIILWEIYEFEESRYIPPSQLFEIKRKTPKSIESLCKSLEGMTLSLREIEKKIRGICFQQCSFNRTMGTIEAWKLGSMQIYRETLVDTRCNNYSTFT